MSFAFQEVIGETLLGDAVSGVAIIYFGRTSTLLLGLLVRLLLAHIGRHVLIRLVLQVLGRIDDVPTVELTFLYRVLFFHFNNIYI